MINSIICLFKLIVIFCGLGYQAIIFRLFRKQNEKDQYEYVSKCANKYAWRLIRAPKCRVKIIGRENVPEGGIVFIANHQSYFDIPLLAGAYGHAIGYVAKKESKVPIISTWAIEMKSIFIDRDDIKKSIEVMNIGIQNLKKGYPMAIFPEGHRSKTGEIAEFKKGSLRLGTKSGVPIVPVVIKGSRNIFEANKLPDKIKKVDVTLCFLEPICYNDLSKEDQKNITSIVENRIKEKFYSI